MIATGVLLVLVFSLAFAGEHTSFLYPQGTDYVVTNIYHDATTADIFHEYGWSGYTVGGPIEPTLDAWIILNGGNSLARHWSAYDEGDATWTAYDVECFNYDPPNDVQASQLHHLLHHYNNGADSGFGKIRTVWE